MAVAVAISFVSSFIRSVITRAKAGAASRSYLYNIIGVGIYDAILLLTTTPATVYGRATGIHHHQRYFCYYLFGSAFLIFLFPFFVGGAGVTVRDGLRRSTRRRAWVPVDVAAHTHKHKCPGSPHHPASLAICSIRIHINGSSMSL